MKYNTAVVGALKEAIYCVISPVENVGRSIVASLMHGNEPLIQVLSSGLRMKWNCDDAR